MEGDGQGDRGHDLEGEIGIMPGHEPFLAILAEAPLRIERSMAPKLSSRSTAASSPWIPTGSISLLRWRKWLHEIDVERAKVALERAKARAHEEESEARAAKRAETRLNVAMGAGH